MFYSKIKVLQELPQNGHHFRQKKDNPIFGQPMGNVHASLRPYLVPSHMTLQIAVFLNSHPRPTVVMAGQLAIFI